MSLANLRFPSPEPERPAHMVALYEACRKAPAFAQPWPEPHSETLKDRLLAVLSYSSLNQLQFADRADISENYASQILQGKREPSRKILARIAKVFSVNEAWLLLGHGKMHGVQA